jgi:putative membrane protein
VFLGIAVAIVVAGILFTVASYDPHLFGRATGSGLAYGGGFLGFFLIVWGCLMLVRVAFWTTRRRHGGRGRGFDPAILEARRRYARGEITREQFEQIVSDLRRPPGPLP